MPEGLHVGHRPRRTRYLLAMSPDPKLAIQTQPKFNEVFFAERVVVVEGISDLACIEAYTRLPGKRSDFQKSRATIVVCEGKSSLALMILIMESFKFPYHAIFDCDSKYDEKFKENPDRFWEPYNEHIRDNNAILDLTGKSRRDLCMCGNESQPRFASMTLG